ncbi:MAG TPA: helix-turn-helix transcriptional regulator [Candidatus Onthomonas avicola]|nr:helix-turn-helix transcriptional regulator [Candidatus Onthomonas avicola]
MRPVKSMCITSELMGLERSKLRRYERGELEPRRPDLIAIAKYYGVSIDYLCTGHASKKKL